MAPMALLSHHVPFICEEANRTQGKQRPLGIHSPALEARGLWRDSSN